MPRLAAVVVLLALVALSGSISYAGYLVLDVVADFLGTGRFVTGLLFGALFARLPWVSQGKLRTIGLLPRHARRPVMLVLLAWCITSLLNRGEIAPALFPGFAAVFLLAYPSVRRKVVNHMLSFLPGAMPCPARRGGNDPDVIDVEVREKKD